MKSVLVILTKWIAYIIYIFLFIYLTWFFVVTLTTMVVMLLRVLRNWSPREPILKFCSTMLKTLKVACFRIRIRCIISIDEFPANFLVYVILAAASTVSPPREHSPSTPTAPAKCYQNSPIAFLFGKHPGALTRNSCEIPEDNFLRICFSKSPLPIRAHFPGWANGILPDPEYNSEGIYSGKSFWGPTGSCGRRSQKIIRK